MTTKRLSHKSETSLTVIPAQAGIQFLMVFLDPRLRGGDGLSEF